MMIEAARKTLRNVVGVMVLYAMSAQAIDTFSDSPLSMTGASAVQPNIMFTLDDSGSMSWDYLPDWSTLYTDSTAAHLIRYDSPVAQQDLFRNPQYNGLAYNPAIRYTPPFYLNADGTHNTTNYPSMTGTSAVTGADINKSLPNWGAVPVDAYGVQTLAVAAYVGPGGDNTCPDGTFNKISCDLEAVNTNVTPNVPYAFSYQFAAGEFCSDIHQKSCQMQLGNSPSYPLPSMLRWCTTLTNQNDCQALYDSTGTLPSGKRYIYPRAAGSAVGASYGALVTVSACSSCSVTSVTLNGAPLNLPTPTDPAHTTTVSGINSASDLARKLYQVLPLAIRGLGVSSLNTTTNTFMVYLPVSSAPTLSFTASGATISVGGFTSSPTNIVGSNTPIYISINNDSYTKTAGARTDCAAADHCTYAEEMTNYANWLAYYRTRMQMMKTVTSLAFENIDDHSRVGFYTISRSSFVNPDSFQPAIKRNWYDKLFATDAPGPNGTPLRGAISRIGQLYAGLHIGDSWGGQIVVDPMQYQCQKNFDLLATDGNWNTSDETSDASGRYGSYALNNTVPVNEQDGAVSNGTPSPGASPWDTNAIPATPGTEPRPQYDGQHPIYTQTQSQTTETQTQWTRTDNWFEVTTTGTQQQIWNLEFTVDTWGLTQSTTSFTKVETPYTFDQVTTPYLWKQDVTAYDWDVTITPTIWQEVDTTYNYKVTTTPIIWKEVDTTYNYKVTTTPIVWKEIDTPYTFDVSTTPYTWTKTETDYTWTKVHYTGVPAYTYLVDSVPTTTSYCPYGPSHCTVSYPSYTSNTTTGLNHCSPSGSSGDSHYTTCQLVASTSPTVTTTLSSCSPNSVPTSSGTYVQCQLVAGTASVQHTQASCTPAAVPSTYGNYVTCTPVPASGTRTYHGGTCPTMAAPTSAGGTANTAVTCSLVADPNISATVDDNQGSCSPSGTLTVPGNQITCAAGSTSGNTTTQYPASCSGVTLTVPSSSGGTGGTNVVCSIIADPNTAATVQDNQGACTPSATMTAPGNKVTCGAGSTSGTTSTTLGNPTCVNATVYAPSTSGGTGGVNVACSLVPDPNNPATTQHHQSTCTPSSAPTGPSSPTSCNSVAGQTTTTYQQTCNSGNTTTPSGFNVTACLLVADPNPANTSTINAATCTPAAMPTVAPGNYVTCTSLAGSSTTSTAASCNGVNPPSINGGSATAVTAVVCTPLSIPNVNITNAGGSCPSSTAAQSISCTALQKIPSLNLTHQPTCANAANVTGSVLLTASSVGEVTCVGQYVPANAAPYWVANATTVGTYYSSAPTYGSAPLPNYSTASMVYSQPTVTNTTSVASSCTPSLPNAIPAIACNPASSVTHPSSCSNGSAAVAAYTNSSSVSFAGDSGLSQSATVSCSNATLINNQLVDPATCTYANNIPFYDGTSGTTTTCSITQTQTPGLTACNDDPPTATNNLTTTSCTATGFAGGSSNSLADITEYYYRTDLRPAGSGRCTGAIVNSITNDVCLDVTANNADTVQNMTTYTLGLGTSGQMVYSANYKNPADTTGDYYNIAQGTTATATICPWVTSGQPCDWPLPVSNTITAIDDLWHAAVNGRGTYFSANDSTTLINSLSAALGGISSTVGAGSAATPQSSKPISGNNTAYATSYKTGSWVGDVQARVIDLSNGSVSTGLDNGGNSTCPPNSGVGCLWSAQWMIDHQNGSTTGGANASTSAPNAISTGAGRSIYLEPYPGTGTTMRPFNYAALHSDEAAYFTNGISNNPQLQVQVTNVRPVNTVATQLVDFLAGNKTLENLGFRKRDNILGDIVDSAAVFSGAPQFGYGDAGYASFKASNVTRAGVVYVQANDGMLHALNAATGNENWAFVPRAALPQMYALADTAYSHRFYLDGITTIGDAYFTSDSSWHTVLVAGYGKGGTGYFALDITDPTQPPKFLWSVDANTTGFDNLGYSYGDAQITKLPNGTWVALFASGYNNADGHGHLYGVDIADGSKLFDLSTATSDGGTATTPSNLGKISPWVENSNVNNVAYFVYAGDFLGNVWRFDLGTDPATPTTSPAVVPCNGPGSIHGCTTGQSVFQLAQLTAPDGTAQPITTHIELTTYQHYYRLVFVSTGSYLTVTDPASSQVQSTYAILDALEDLAADPTAQSTFVAPRTLMTSTTPVKPLFAERYLVADTVTSNNVTTNVRVACATSTCSTPGAAINYSKQAGWYVDYPEAGERVNVDQQLALGTLTVPSNIPASNACQSLGHAWLNNFNYATGLSIVAYSTGSTTQVGVASRPILSGMIVGLNQIEFTPDPTCTSNCALPENLPCTVTLDCPTSPIPYQFAPFQNKLDSWRDLEAF